VNIVALDLGTQCGYAYTHDGVPRIELSGVMDFRSQRHEGAGMRFLRFRRALQDLLKNEDEDAVCVYEEVAAHRGTAAAHVYGGLLAVLQSLCESMDIPYRGYPVGTIKRHATGKGNANKDAMVDAARERFGDEIDDDNQADALWLLDLALKELDGRD